jgi:hypothetical protein
VLLFFPDIHADIDWSRGYESLDKEFQRITRESGRCGLKELAGLKRLTMLDLKITLVTDAGIKELIGLNSLRQLDLSYTRVTDAGIKDMAQLNVIQLDVSRTAATNEGEAELKKAMPKCKVLRCVRGSILDW